MDSHLRIAYPIKKEILTRAYCEVYSLQHYENVSVDNYGRSAVYSGTTVSFTIRIDRHDVNKIFLMVAL